MEKPQYAILRFAKYRGRRLGALKPMTSAPRRNTPATIFDVFTQIKNGYRL